MHVLRQLCVDARGVVIYGTSSQPLLDEASGASLPVFDRLAVYRLEPSSVRSLSRSLERLGVADWVSPSRSGDGPLGLSISWRAFGERNVLVSAGPPRGRLADIVSLIASYLPPGESFEAPLRRPVVPVLRGVPAPRRDLGGALAALEEQLMERSDDAVLLLNAFAMACRVGDRATAERLLEGWIEVQRGLATEQRAVFDEDSGTPSLQQGAALRRLLPRAPQVSAVAGDSAARR